MIKAEKSEVHFRSHFGPVSRPNRQPHRQKEITTKMNQQKLSVCTCPRLALLTRAKPMCNQNLKWIRNNEIPVFLSCGKSFFFFFLSFFGFLVLFNEMKIRHRK